MSTVTELTSCRRPRCPARIGVVRRGRRPRPAEPQERRRPRWCRASRCLRRFSFPPLSFRRPAPAAWSETPPRRRDTAGSPGSAPPRSAAHNAFFMAAIVRGSGSTHPSPPAHAALGNTCFRCYKVEMEIRLLGPFEVRDGERTVALPRRQQRALLAALALRAGEVVSTDRLVADLWGERAPASATGSLQNTVSALRKALGRDVVLTQAPGYRLALERESVDAHRFERSRRCPRRRRRPARAPPPDRSACPLARPRARRSRRGAVRPASCEAAGRATGGTRSRSGSTPSWRSEGTRRSSASSRPWSPRTRFESVCAAS